MNLRERRRCQSAVVLGILLGLLGSGTAYAAGGPPECWVSWRPSEGSIAFENTGRNDTLMKFRLKWRSEDLTFRTCRYRTAFELETFFGVSDKRHKLGSFKIHETNLPRVYIDSDREKGEVTFGIANADDLRANEWYSLTYYFKGRLGPDERLAVDASRGYRKSPCPFGDALCVFGWEQDDIYGPAERIEIIHDPTDVDQGTHLSWSYPSRATLLNRIIRHPDQGDAYVVDGSGIKHWIPDGGTYLCLINSGMLVVNSFAGLDQRWVINSFSQGSNATCTSPSPTPTPNPTPTPPPSGGTISLAKGSSAPAGYWYSVTLGGFAAGSSVTVTCRDSVDPQGFWTQTFTMNSSGQASDSTLCYSADGPDHWVTGGGVESNHVVW